jgi:hypothetical protein
MRTEMMAAAESSSSSEKVSRRPSPSVAAIAITIAVLVGAVAAAGVVSLVIIVGDYGTDEVVVYGIGTSPSGTIKVVGDPNERLLLFTR